MCYFIIKRQFNIKYIRFVASFVLRKLGLKKNVLPFANVRTSVVLGTHLWPLSILLLRGTVDDNSLIVYAKGDLKANTTY